jgi:hypothetical protein
MADMVNDAQALNTSTDVEYHSETEEYVLLPSPSVMHNYPFPLIEIEVYTTKRKESQNSQQCFTQWNSSECYLMTENMPLRTSSFLEVYV